MASMRVEAQLARLHSEFNVVLPDPARLLRCWITEFTELLPRLPEALDGDDPTVARRLLTSWARLMRAKPALVAAAAGRPPEPGGGVAEQLGLPELAAWERRLRDEHMAALVERAKATANPKAWSERLQVLRRAVDAAEEPEDLPDRTVELLNDLDEQELLDACAVYAGRTDLSSEALLGVLRAAVCAEVDLFLPAREYVLEVAQTLPGEPTHAAFAPTYSKFEAILDEILAAELFAEGPAAPSWFRTEQLLAETMLIGIVAALLEAYRAQRPAVLAAAGEAEREEYRSALWLSPDKRFVAQLRWAPADAARRKLPILFRHASMVQRQVVPTDAASELAGARVEFAGATAVIDEQATAWFDVDALAPVEKERSWQLARLVVRRNGTTETWTLTK